MALRRIHSINPSVTSATVSAQLVRDYPSNTQLDRPQPAPHEQGKISVQVPIRSPPEARRPVNVTQRRQRKAPCLSRAQGVRLGNPVFVFHSLTPQRLALSPENAMDVVDHSELSTLRDLLRYAVSRFNSAGLSFGHGSDNAWDEAAYLLLHCLHLPLDRLEPFLDARVISSERQRFLALIERRCSERLPAAYLTGEAWLQGMRFIADARAIVPRSPISELLVHGLAPWINDPDAIETTLDLCTGSGCLAILMAFAFENAQVDAVDLSADALALAQENIALYGMDGRITTHQSDLFKQLPDTAYDLIVCNPPYVNSRSMEALPGEYQHEPSLALAGGTDGMELIREILAEAPDFMAPEGVLILEIGHEYDNFAAAFPELDPVWLSTERTEDQILMLTREQLAS